MVPLLAIKLGGFRAKLTMCYLLYLKWQMVLKMWSSCFLVKKVRIPTNVYPCRPSGQYLI